MGNAALSKSGVHATLRSSCASVVSAFHFLRRRGQHAEFAEAQRAADDSTIESLRAADSVRVGRDPPRPVSPEDTDLVENVWGIWELSSASYRPHHGL